MTSLKIKQMIGDKAGEAQTWHQLGFLAFDEGRMIEGIRLIAVGYLIAQSIKSGDMQIIQHNLSEKVHGLKYTQEQFNTMLREVIESYQVDGGQQLLEDAFIDKWKTTEKREVSGNSGSNHK
jgi:hypothetical protein